MIDLYCERCGPGLLAEPLNATTNLAFLIAAWAAWVLARRLNSLSGGIQGLIFLTVSLGIGSALFHTFATAWARVLDVVPILLFEPSSCGFTHARSSRFAPYSPLLRWLSS